MNFHIFNTLLQGTVNIPFLGFLLVATAPCKANVIMENEIWKDITGYECAYQISSLGRVRSLRSNKVLKNHFGTAGYWRITLCKDGISKRFEVHRLVGKEFISNTENNPQINHKDGIKTNNKPENLEWVTLQENIDHAKENGLMDFSFGGKRHVSPVSCYTPSGKLIKDYETIESAIADGVERYSLLQCLKGEKLVYKGKVWKYTE